MSARKPRVHKKARPGGQVARPPVLPAGEIILRDVAVLSVTCRARPAPCVVAFDGGVSAMVNDERMLATLLAALTAARHVTVLLLRGRAPVPPAPRIDLVVGVRL